MKGLLTVTIDNVHSPEALRQAIAVMEKACENGRRTIDNGASISIRACHNAEDVQQLQNLMGKLKWWSLGREREQAPQKKKGFLRHLWEDDW